MLAVISQHPGVNARQASILLDDRPVKTLEKQIKSVIEKEVFPKFGEFYPGLGEITTGFIGMVDKKGALNLYDGNIRLMKPDGSCKEFRPDEYLDHLAEKVVPFSYGKFPYAKSWGEGFSMDLDAPKGIYRSNTLARINVGGRFEPQRPGK